MNLSQKKLNQLIFFFIFDRRLNRRNIMPIGQLGVKNYIYATFFLIIQDPHILPMLYVLAKFPKKYNNGANAMFINTRADGS